MITIGLLYGLIAIGKLDMTLNNVAKDSRLEVVQMSVFVSSDDNANELRDIEGASVGYLESDNAADQVMSVIDGTVATEVQYKAYNNILFMADALLNGTERAIIMNSAYVDIISDQDGYEDFSDRIRNYIHILQKFRLKYVEMLLMWTVQKKNIFCHQMKILL